MILNRVRLFIEYFLQFEKLFLDFFLLDLVLILRDEIKGTNILFRKILILLLIKLHHNLLLHTQLLLVKPGLITPAEIQEWT